MKILNKVPFIAALVFLLFAILSYVSVAPLSDVSNKNFISDLDFASGASAFGLVSVVMLLALKSRFLESIVPLDSIYRLHKYLGMAAAFILCFHVFCHDIMRPLMPYLREIFDANSNAPIQRVPGVLALIGRKSAESVGTYIALAALFLLIITFINRISYRRWLSLHHIFAYLYLISALHILPLITADNLKTPLGIFFVPLTVSGVLASVAIVSGFHNRHGAIQLKKLSGSVISDMIFLKLDARALDVSDDSRFYLLKTGGFNYHPFTAVYNKKDRALEFAIREQGPFTAYLKENIDRIDEFTLKGPFGAFNVNLPDNGQRALYIANGVGIISFVPFMQRLVRSDVSNRDIGFIFIFKSKSDPAYNFVLSDLKMLKAAGVGVDVIYTKSDGRPDALFFKNALKGCDIVYVSGSSSMTGTIKRQCRAWCNKGYKIHHEYIDFRKLM